MKKYVIFRVLDQENRHGNGSRPEKDGGVNQVYVLDRFFFEYPIIKFQSSNF